jgi:hypothetical protein
MSGTHIGHWNGLERFPAVPGRPNIHAGFEAVEQMEHFFFLNCGVEGDAQTAPWAHPAVIVGKEVFRSFQLFLFLFQHLHRMQFIANPK